MGQKNNRKFAEQIKASCFIPDSAKRGRSDVRSTDRPFHDPRKAESPKDRGLTKDE